MIEGVRRRLSLDQAEANSLNRVSLQNIKKSLSGNSGFFNSRFKFFYDRKLRAIILRAEDLTVKSKRYVSLSAAQSMLLRAIQEELSGFKKTITAADLLGKVSLRKCCLETIGRIMKTLVKKKILVSEKIQLQDQVIEVFKFK